MTEDERWRRETSGRGSGWQVLTFSSTWTCQGHRHPDCAYEKKAALGVSEPFTPGQAPSTGPNLQVVRSRPPFAVCTPGTAGRVLIPRPGIEPVPPAVEAQCPKHWTSKSWEDSFQCRPGLGSDPQMHRQRSPKAFRTHLPGPWPLAPGPLQGGPVPSPLHEPPRPSPPSRSLGLVTPAFPAHERQARPVHRSWPRTIWGQGGDLKPALTQSPFLLPASLTFLPGVHRNPGSEVDHAVPGPSLDRKKGAGSRGPRLRRSPRT